MDNNQQYNNNQNVNPKQQKAEKMQQRHANKKYKKVKKQIVYVPPQWGPNGPIETKPRKILDLSRVGKFGLWWTVFATLFIGIYGALNLAEYGILAFYSQADVSSYLIGTGNPSNIILGEVIADWTPEEFALWQAGRVAAYWSLLWVTVGAFATLAATFLIPYDFRFRLPVGIAAIFFGGVVGGFMLLFSSIMEYDVRPQPTPQAPFGQQPFGPNPNQNNTQQNNNGFNNQYYNPNDPYGRPETPSNNKEIEVEVETNENKGN